MSYLTRVKMTVATAPEAALPATAAGLNYQRKKNPGVPSGANSRPKFLRWVFSAQLLSSTLKRPDIGQ